jgi:hypothetical protein
MSESTLSMGYPDYRKLIGRFLGYGGTSTNWSADQIDEIQFVMDSGLRRFYTAYDWRFLKPVTTQATVASTYNYTLPDAFGFMIGDLTYATTDSGWDRIRLVEEMEIRRLRQTPTNTTGRPRLAAVRPLTTTGSTGQRFELIFYPTPDAVYTLTYQYRALPYQITASLPYPFGGEMHAETILEAMLAVAEERHDDEKGIHNQTYLTMLQQSILMDQQQGAEFFGYNGDFSDGNNLINRRDRINPTTFNGVQY